ncbi:ribosome maturation factor RimP [Govanella unica]|uniref:Ribosome maturation factor RimP n=1 Tax=Govanella unica TaxID=2975056 RepID=A0A9X3TZ29_9PROT|nr:ribosome maturation factor RimP [Govania unica]MDA5194616.1 ribosome maturation factor RimP [Govania unica]
MTTDAERLEAMLAPVAAEFGFDLVRLVISKVGGHSVILQILAERPDGSMTIDDCSRLSRAFSAVLDEQDPLRDAYTLEVGSPGIDRPLMRLKDFERFAGREARLEVKTALEGQRRFQGVLAGVRDGQVLLKVAAEDAPAGLDVAEPLALAMDEILKAKLIASDAFLKADLTRAEQLLEAAEGDNTEADPDIRKPRPGQKQKRSG